MSHWNFHNHSALQAVRTQRETKVGMFFFQKDNVVTGDNLLNDLPLVDFCLRLVA